MRAMVVEADMLSALRLSEALSTVGFDVVGPVRSSGEALLLAQANAPDVVVLGTNLERVGAGHRLAGRLELDLNVPAIVAESGEAALDVAKCESLAALALQRRKPRR